MRWSGTAGEKGLQSGLGKAGLESEKSQQRVLAGIWESRAQPWSAHHGFVMNSARAVVSSPGWLFSTPRHRDPHSCGKRRFENDVCQVDSVLRSTETDFIAYL